MPRSLSYGGAGGSSSGGPLGGSGAPIEPVAPPTAVIFAPDGAEVTRVLTSSVTNTGTRQWLRDGAPIFDATLPTYQVQESDANLTITLHVEGPGGTADSNAIVIDSLPFPDIGYVPPELVAVLQLPAAPVIVNYVDAYTAEELLIALQTPESDITYYGSDPGGTLVMETNDIILRLAGATLETTIIEFATDVHRVEIRGVGHQVQQINFRLPAYYDDVLGQVFDAALKTTDIRLVQLRVINTSGSAALVYGSRIYFDTVDLLGEAYGLFCGAAGDVFNEDIIYTSGYCQGSQEASMRILQTTRHACTRSVLGTSGVSFKHSWRLHRQTSMAYCGSCTLNASGTMLTDPADPTDTLGRFWFNDNRINYTLTNGVIVTLDPYTRIEQGAITNNRFYMAPSVVTFSQIWSYGAVPGDWALSGNTFPNSL